MTGAGALDLMRPSLARLGPADAWPPDGGRIANHLGWLAREPWPAFPPIAPDALGAAVAQASRLRLSVVQPEGMWAVRDVGAAITDGARRLGLEVAAPVERAAAGDDTLTFTVCTPGALGRIADMPVEAGRHCAVVAGVAQEGDLAHALPHLSRLRAVACTDPALVSLLQAAGAPALLWSPVRGAREPQGGIHDPLLAGLPRRARGALGSADVWSERPLDLVSIGPEGGVRTHLLGAGAADLARRACVLVHRRAMWRLGDEPILAEATADHLFRRAKVVLNVHAGEAAGLDWSLGVLDAMALGAVAVSTPCFPHPFLHKDVHYLEATPDRMLQLVDWLLDTGEGRKVAEAVRSAAAGALAAVASPSRMAARLLTHALAAHPQAAQG